jgi:SAM-dependent methyltransferase
VTVSAPTSPELSPIDRFRRDYMRLREREGRGSGGDEELLALPYLSTGPTARQWQVHARSFRCLLRRVVGPMARAAARRALDVLDLGAGNGWLSHRLCRLGHRPVACDVRLDVVDGLAAAAAYARHLEPMFPRLAAAFEHLPVAEAAIDLVVFDNSLHYASELGQVLAEAVRVLRPDGRVAVVDSPFYRRDRFGQAMAEAKERATREHLGDLADGLLARPAIEFLTADALARASAPLGLRWRRHRVLYPLWYEWRAVSAALRRRRPPSRFDVWEGVRR